MYIYLIINIDNVATGDQDMGRHTVCMSATDEFLEYSKSVGNDLSTPGKLRKIAFVQCNSYEYEMQFI